jgi:hypothetical protein
LGIFWEDDSIGTQGLLCQFAKDNGIVPIVLTNITSADECRQKCTATIGCSHYEWITFVYTKNPFTTRARCQLKFGMIRKEDAIFVTNVNSFFVAANTDVCGIVNAGLSVSKAEIRGKIYIFKS